MLPIVFGLAAAMLAAGCAGTEPPSPPPPVPQPEPELPEQNFTPSTRDYFHRLTQAGFHSRLMDRGYLIAPRTGQYFELETTVRGDGDGLVDGIEVYLGALRFAQEDPSNEFLQGLLQDVVGDPVSRNEFGDALMHSPEDREGRLTMAESLWSWSLLEHSETAYLWVRLAGLQERRGDFEHASESYRNALHRHEGGDTYDILMRLANVQRAMGRTGMANYYEGLARDRRFAPRTR